MKKAALMSIIVLAVLRFVKPVFAEDPNLSIYDIQFTVDVSGDSNYVGEVVNCLGGVVIHKYAGFNEKLFLYDGTYCDGWGGIVVKDFTGGTLFNDVNVGDWVSLTATSVEEFRGNTQLFFDYESSFEVKSSNNPLPRPLLVSLADIPAPKYDADLDGWFVSDHNCEKYEAMYLKVIDVNVGEMDLGKAGDNYFLQNPDDPNLSCWAADYINDDLPEGNDYHPLVEQGRHFCRVAGILEQYTNLNTGWDYYQLLTTKTEDFLITQTADLDSDCDVDFLDFGVFAQHWLQEGCSEPDWCGGADLVHDANAVVDTFDLLEFTRNWLEGKY